MLQEDEETLPSQAYKPQVLDDVPADNDVHFTSQIGREDVKPVGIGPAARGVLPHPGKFDEAASRERVSIGVPESGWIGARGNRRGHVHFVD